MSKPLQAGDVIRLINPEYGEPTEDCTVITDQTGSLVWFRSEELSSQNRGPCFVARRTEVKVIRYKNSEESRS